MGGFVYDPHQANILLNQIIYYLALSFSEKDSYKIIKT